MSSTDIKPKCVSLVKDIYFYLLTKELYADTKVVHSERWSGNANNLEELVDEAANILVSKFQEVNSKFTIALSELDKTDFKSILDDNCEPIDSVIDTIKCFCPVTALFVYELNRLMTVTFLNRFIAIYKLVNPPKPIVKKVAAKSKTVTVTKNVKTPVKRVDPTSKTTDATKPVSKTSKTVVSVKLQQVKTTPNKKTMSKTPSTVKNDEKDSEDSEDSEDEPVKQPVKNIKKVVSKKNVVTSTSTSPIKPAKPVKTPDDDDNDDDTSLKSTVTPKKAVAVKRTPIKKTVPEPVRAVSTKVKVIMDPVSRKFVIKDTKFVVDDPESITVIGTLDGNSMNKLTSKTRSAAVNLGFKVLENLELNTDNNDSEDSDSDSDTDVNPNDTTNILKTYNVASRSISAEKILSKKVKEDEKEDEKD